MAPGTEAPPGPKISRWASWTYRFSADPLNFLTTLARTYGDLASYRMGGELIFFVNNPQYIRDVLVTHNRNFTKSRGLERSKPLLGNGLLTSEGDFHARQRRLMQPASIASGSHPTVEPWSRMPIGCAARGPTARCSRSRRR
jgi:cytochrome P450